MNDFISMGAIAMTAFFLLSGYSMYLSYENKNLGRIADMKLFYIKRFLNILPLYYVVAIIFIIIYRRGNLLDELLLLPIEALGIQSVFTTLFPISHNDGTWFVSCILICYLIYPFMQEVIKQSNVQQKMIYFFVGLIIMLWSPIVILKFNLSNIYSNPFFRMLEFFMGAILCSLKGQIEKLPISKKIYSPITICVEWIALIAMISVGIKLNVQVGDYMLYNWIALPLFAIILVSMSGTDFRIFNKTFIRYLCKISYAFFMAQFFVFKLTKRILSILGQDGNFLKIVLSFTLCCAFSIAFYEFIEKPISSLLKNKFFEKA
ncbi:MAG: acyltransferase family protein [Clostridium fessum]